MRLSQLNDNLVLLFSDYMTGNLFLSFIGSNKVSETGITLIESSKKYLNEDTLKLIPEFIAQFLCSQTFSVIPERDSFDYIYSTADFCQMLTWPGKYRASQQLRAFMHRRHSFHFEYHSLAEVDKTLLRKLYRHWASNKNLDHYVTNEFLAFDRLLQTEANFPFAVIIFIDHEPKGFSLIENLPGNSTLIHFAKANITYGGEYEVLYWQMSQILRKDSVMYMNFEQDLGLENLCQSKKKYVLHNFLKKYLVQLK